MTEQPNKEWLGIMCLILGSLGFAMKGIIVKLTMQVGVTSEAIMIWRYGLALPFFWAFIALRGDVKHMLNCKKEVIFLILGAAFFGYYIATYCDYKALENLPATTSRFILFTFPVFVVLWQTMRKKEWPPKRQIAAILCIQVGMYFLLLAEGMSISESAGEGMVWGVCAALSFSVYLINMQRVGKQLSAGCIATLAVTVGFVCGMAEFTINDRWAEEFALTADAFWLLLLMAFFATFLPITLMMTGLQSVGASRAALVSSLNPAFTVVLAYIFLEEIMTPTQWVGGVTIFLSVIILEGKIPVRRLFRRQI
jgi:drug/metabolite transporter (DMT)-like permease